MGGGWDRDNEGRSPKVDVHCSKELLSRRELDAVRLDESYVLLGTA